jgi:hypothetical protein
MHEPHCWLCNIMLSSGPQVLPFIPSVILAQECWFIGKIRTRLASSGALVTVKRRAVDPVHRVKRFLVLKWLLGLISCENRRQLKLALDLLHWLALALAFLLYLRIVLQVRVRSLPKFGQTKRVSHKAFFVCELLCTVFVEGPFPCRFSNNVRETAQRLPIHLVVDLRPTSFLTDRS